MYRFLVTLVVIALIICLLLIVILYKDDVKLQDNLTYRIIRFRPHFEMSKMILFNLNQDTMKLISHMKRKYANRLSENVIIPSETSDLDNIFGTIKKDVLQTLKKQIKSNVNINNSKIEPLKLLLKNYNPDLLVENDPIFTLGAKTYTVNFRQIYICIRRMNYTFYDYNLLMFVFIHELAHTATPARYLWHDGEFDTHPNIYWRIFKFFLSEAVEVGIYNPIDYSIKENSVNYCGTMVENNPLYDDTLGNLI